MTRKFKTFCKKVVSRDTWRKVDYLMAKKDPGLGLKPIKREDYVPLILAVVVTLFIMIIIFVVLSRLNSCVKS